MATSQRSYTHDNFYYDESRYSSDTTAETTLTAPSMSTPIMNAASSASSSTDDSSSIASPSSSSSSSSSSTLSRDKHEHQVREVTSLEEYKSAVNHIYKEKCKVSVLGIGGAGCNAVDGMFKSSRNVQGIHLFAVNTDAQALKKTLCNSRIQIGVETTRGLGAGSVPQIGRKSAEENLTTVMDHVKDSQMLFLAAGMGGGTGTGAAPIIGSEARKMGILTVGVITTPFAFEGTRRQKIAGEGLRELEKAVDTLIVVPNENILNISTKATTVNEAFKVADDVLVEGVKSITDLILEPGLINLDFADVRAIMKDGGVAFMGTGYGFRDSSSSISRDMLLTQAVLNQVGNRSDAMTSISRGRAAVSAALQNPLLDVKSISQARNVLLSIAGGPDLTLHEVQDISNMIKGHVHEDANIIIGASNDQEVPEGAIKVSVIVTGIPKDFVVEKAETQQTIQPDIVIMPATNRSDESNHVKQSEKEVGFLRRLFRNHW